MMRRRVLALVAVASLAAACTVPAQQVQPTAQAPAAGMTVTAPGVTTNRVTVEGAVRVPNGLVAAGGMNLVAAGGMNLVAAGGMNLVAAGGMNLVAAGGMNLVAAGGMNEGPKAGGNLVAAGGMNYDLQAVSDQTLAGVVVFLCDGLGRPIPGLPPVATDAEGRYQIPHVPAGFTLVVNALVPYQDGKRGLLVALSRTGDGQAVEVDAASTLAAVRAAAIRKDGQLGPFEAAVFKNAVGDVRDALTDPTTPDYRDAVAVGLRAAELEGSVPGLAGKLQALRAAIAKGPDAPTGPSGPEATPLPSPSVAPEATPTPKPIPTANAPLYTPKPTATPTPAVADCGPVKRLTFKVRTLGGIRVVFRKPDPNDPNRLNWPIAASALLEPSGDVTKPIDFPAGCTYRVELVTADGRALGSEDTWQAPADAAGTVQLPF